MKQAINSKYLSIFIFILSIIVIIKVLWMTVSLLFLPTIGEEYKKLTQAKKLYYRVRLSSKKEGINPINQAPNNLNGRANGNNPVNQMNTMKGYKLLGLYNSKKILVVTVAKGSKTTILAKGEKIDGFELVSAGANFAIFKKNSEESLLTLLNTKTTGKNSSHTKSTSRSSVQSTKTIVEEDGVKQIPKNLLSSYTKDMSKIWKDIGLAQYKKNGKPDGFKVNFVKKGSDIEKLGLRRGDILKAINAEPLNLSSSMNFFNNINSLENLTLTVERNGVSEDIEYEIQ